MMDACWLLPDAPCARFGRLPSASSSGSGALAGSWPLPQKRAETGQGKVAGRCRQVKVAGRGAGDPARLGPHPGRPSPSTCTGRPDHSSRHARRQPTADRGESSVVPRELAGSARRRSAAGFAIALARSASTAAARLAARAADARRRSRRYDDSPPWSYPPMSAARPPS
jgi:hypothetical protein